MDSKLYNEIGKVVERAEKFGGTLTEKNMLYVAKVADDVSKASGVDFETLFSEGIIGMMKFEEKFDPTKHDNFVKAAAPSVRGYMINFINRQNNLVHIPVNQLQGFKKGQKRVDGTNVEMVHIDSMDYDTLGVDDYSIEQDRERILNEGLMKLDINGRIAVMMKLRLGKYATVVQSKDDPSKTIYKYNNNIASIANELNCPKAKVAKIYKDAFTKLQKYCQAAYNN